MTPKEEYEVRKAQRKASREQPRVHPQQRGYDGPDKDERIEDMLDRFVTAVERIADALAKETNDGQ